VETNLFGRIAGKSATIPMLWWDGREHTPTNGMRALVFYAKGFSIGMDSIDRQHYSFDWEKPPEVPDAPLGIIWKDMSNLRILDSPETENAYIEAVGGYLRLLRLEKRDPDRYYEFLRPLANSPVWQLRQDAKEDLLWLVGDRCPDRFDPARVLNDPEMDWDLLKDYARHIAIPAREKRNAGQKKSE
jgi:hypothetical protein